MLNFMGEDPDGPSPFEDSANNVIVDTVSINNGEDLARDISYHLDLLRASDHMGNDIYQDVLEFVERGGGGGHRITELLMQCFTQAISLSHPSEDNV